VFWLIIVVTLVVAWLQLSSMFVHIGDAWVNLFKKTKKDIIGETEAEEAADTDRKDCEVDE
jgi:hypothetical protein